MIQVSALKAKQEFCEVLANKAGRVLVKFLITEKTQSIHSNTAILPILEKSVHKAKFIRDLVLHLSRFSFPFTHVSRLHAGIARFPRLQSRYVARALPWLLSVTELNHA